MSAAVPPSPAHLTPRQARRWTWILVFLGALTFASVAAKSVTDDRCEMKDEPLLNQSGLSILNQSDQPIMVRLYECRRWTIRGNFPYIGIEYVRLPDFARPSPVTATPPATLP
jgi:hypothetical protein